jgi:4-hydroxy-L-threonine phosphate dehydrogenase PdxA
MSDKAKIAIATGDPAGIGPEISLKAALDPAVRDMCHPIVVSVTPRRAGSLPRCA